VGLDPNLQERDLALGLEERDGGFGRELLVEECDAGDRDKPEYL
jgi:hypothetical protein